MIPIALPEGKDQVLRTFEQILAQRQQLESRVATKEEEAEQAKNAAILEQASQYSTDGIVRGLADLQLSFRSVTTDLTTQLSQENDKLDELGRAIAFETQHLDDLRKIRVVADAIHIATQEHQEKLQALQEHHDINQRDLEKVSTDLRKHWQREQEVYEDRQAANLAYQQHQRELQEEEYNYERDRTRQLKEDELETAQRQQEQAISLEQAQRDKDWAEREATLTENLTKQADYQKQVEGFPEEQDSKVKEAREKAIREVSQQAKVKTDLANKAWEGAEQSYELQIQSFEQKIESQSATITRLMEQLQEALEQSRSLALRAFENSASRSTAA